MISILLPTYNGAKRISKAIESVQAQSYVDWELLVIDDGSKDNTKEVVEDFVKDDSRIKYIKNQENLNIQKSLNKGLREAKGEYIARIDDDDIWIDKDKLKKQIEFLKEDSEYVLVGTGTIVVDENEKELFRYFGPQADSEIRNKILSKNCFTHSSVMFRKSSVEKFGGYSEGESVKHLEDYDLWLKLGTIGKLKNLDIYGVRFSVRSDSISSVNKIEQFQKNIVLSKLYKNKYPNYIKATIFNYVRLFLYKIFKLLPIGGLKNKIIAIYKRN